MVTLCIPPPAMQAAPQKNTIDLAQHDWKTGASGRQAQLQVRIHGVMTLVLQLICTSGAVEGCGVRSRVSPAAAGAERPVMVGGLC